MKRRIRATQHRKYYVFTMIGVLGLFVGAGVVSMVSYKEQQRISLLLNQKDVLIQQYTEELSLYHEKKAQLLEEAEGNGREVWLEEVFVNDFIEVGERIDVRITYANAEDYVVLSNKRIRHCGTSSGIVLLLTEEEILLLSSAMIDTKRYEDTSLYAVAYPELAESISPVTYLPNQEVAKLLNAESRVISFREQLETRLVASNKE